MADDYRYDMMCGFVHVIVWYPRLAHHFMQGMVPGTGNNT